MADRLTLAVLDINHRKGSRFATPGRKAACASRSSQLDSSPMTQPVIRKRSRKVIGTVIVGNKYSSRKGQRGLSREEIGTITLSPSFSISSRPLLEQRLPAQPQVVEGVQGPAVSYVAVRDQPVNEP